MRCSLLFRNYVRNKLNLSTCNLSILTLFFSSTYNIYILYHITSLYTLFVMDVFKCEILDGHLTLNYLNY